MRSSLPRLLLLGFFLGGLAPVGRAAAVAPPVRDERPNVVFILADDLGWNDTSLYGSSFYETPHLEALARRGLKFNQAYAASPLCSPTRASIMTGLAPARLGITQPECHLPVAVLTKGLQPTTPANQPMRTARSVTRLLTSYPTLAEAFRQAGYATAHFGKWHLGPEPYSPLQHGFGSDVPHTPAPSPLPQGFFYPFPVWKNHGRPGDHLEDLVCDEAVRFIAQAKDRPFFLNYWAFEVHSPWQAKERQIAKYRAKAQPTAWQRNPVYAGMVETLDDVVGRLVAALTQAGVLERTIIIFTSDNGPFFVPNNVHMPAEFHPVPVTSAHPLRAGKGTVYEAGTRVPLVVVWPGVTQPGSETEALAQSTDFFPTLADLLALPVPPTVRFDGVSLRPILEGRGAARTEIFCHFPHGQARGEFPGMPAPTPAAPASTLRQGDWKLLRFYGDGPDRTDRHELYDLRRDPGERQDLAATQPERVRSLAAVLDRYLTETGAAIPVPNPDYDPQAATRRGRAKKAATGAAPPPPPSAPPPAVAPGTAAQR